ncbi:MAG TPA: hypothetical protein VKB23_05080 [Solirubrobacterales bacterium]|nr:hypothetical protein [Solirubrobacterales bacterium]
MRHPALWLALAALGLVVIAPASASADFGLLPGPEGFDVAIEREGAPVSGAGTHPDLLQVHLALNTAGDYSDGDLRDLRLTLPAGVIANPAALDECSAGEFVTRRSSPYEASLSGESCPGSSQIGVVAVHTGGAGGTTRHFGLFNLAAPFGSAEAIGFAPFGVPVILAGRYRSDQATLDFELKNLTQALNIQSLDLTLWGTPWEYKYDVERGNCLNEVSPADFNGEASYWKDGIERRYPSTDPEFHAGTCFISLSLDHIHSYLTLPTTCGGQLQWGAAVSSWQGGAEHRNVLSRDSGGDPLTVSDCIEVLAIPRLRLLTDRAAAATGIAFELNVNDGGGFLNVNGRVRSPIQRVSALLPEGLSINPSLGAGLGTCSEAEFVRESATSLPGSGCPNNSKIGTVSVNGLLGLPAVLKGSVFLATPFANPAKNLIALYITLSSPRRGLYFKSFGKAEPDPATGRLVVSFEDLPPIHYDLFTLNLREGQRAAMVSPPTCGAHIAQLHYWPWSDPGLRLESFSSFPINRGADGGECPPPGLPPFHPGLEAGSLNPTAGFYSPFELRMTRTDAEQEITSYSATFPPGLLAKLAGVGVCPDSAIAAARARTGIHGGAEELAGPSCPASSRIGTTLAGYGVGGTLAYAPGALYLAGPYHGAQLSTVAIDSAVVGPFDLGVVVVRSAIRIDPRSAQASIDSAGSDPIPHIIRGIPIHLRDIRVDVDRPDFTLNPTNCDPLTTISTLTGAGLDLYSPADDPATTSSDRFQLSDCSGFIFKPRLHLKLKGGTKRGRYPALKATYTPRPGDPNLKSVAVSLPNSVFLAQEHIGQVCTMPRFRAKTCPANSRIGYARALTPLLAEPLSGPVYLRSSTNLLPDVVAYLSGQGFEVEVVGRIDRARGGGLRGTFELLPDAPVTKFTMNLAGGKHGLLVNSENLCSAPQLASARFIAHDNSTAISAPPIAVKCAKHKQHKRKRGRR